MLWRRFIFLGARIAPKTSFLPTAWNNTYAAGPGRLQGSCGIKVAAACGMPPALIARAAQRAAWIERDIMRKQVRARDMTRGWAVSATERGMAG